MFKKKKTIIKKRKKKKARRIGSMKRFPERHSKDWKGPLVVYREVDLLRKFLTSSAKVMGRKRAGTSSQEQSAIQTALKQARFLALLPYTGT